MIIEGQIGPRAGADGATGVPRFDKTFSQVVSQAGGKYAESSLRGYVFSASTNATSGVAPGTAIGTTAAFALANPAGSKVNLVVLRVSMAYVSGTLGAGAIYYCANVNPIAAAVTGTALTPNNTLLGSRLAATGLPFTTATLPAAAVPLRAFASMVAMIQAGTNQPWQITEDVDGEFVVGPGCTLSLQGQAGAGGTPLVAFGCTWMEVPV